MADEGAVDEHVGVGLVDDDEGGPVLVLDADVDDEPVGADSPGAVDGDVEVFRGPVRMGEGLGGWSGGGSGAPSLDGGLATDALVGAFVVVDPAELVEVGLELGDAGVQWPFAEPLLEGLLESLGLPRGEVTSDVWCREVPLEGCSHATALSPRVP